MKNLTFKIQYVDDDLQRKDEKKMQESEINHRIATVKRIWNNFCFDVTQVFCCGKKNFFAKIVL